MICMKKTLHIDEALLRDAKAAARAKTDTETVRLGLEALIRRGAYERLRQRSGRAPVDELLAIADRIANRVKRPYPDHAKMLYDEHGLPR